MAAAPSAFARLVASASSASAALARVIDGFGITMLAVSAALTFVAVVMRYGFGYSEQIVEEIARYTIVYAALAYVGPLQARGQHIAVDVLASRMPAATRRVWHLVLGVLFLAVVLTVFVGGCIWVRDLYAYDMTVLGGTMPAWIPSVAVPLGMGLAVPFAVAEVLRLVQAVVSPPDTGAAPPSAVPAADAID